MFNSIVVALDLGTAADRAVPVAGALARRGGLPIELLTVVPPAESGGVRPADLDARARVHGLGSHRSLVVEGDDPGAAIAQEVRGRDGTLLVMATTAKAALDESHGGSVSEHVLAASGQPVLLVGPGVDVERPLTPSLVIAVDGSDLAAAALPVVVSWAGTFRGGPVTAIEVLPLVPAIAEQAGPALEERNVRRYADRLGELGVAATGAVVRGGDAAAGLLEAAGGVSDAVLVVTAERWPDAGTHWRSTSRKLALRSTCPVLVVPASRV